MALKEFGLEAAAGWRARVADAVGPRVARRTRFDADQVRALVGGLFFALSLVYVARTLARLLKERESAR